MNILGIDPGEKTGMFGWSTVGRCQFLAGEIEGGVLPGGTVLENCIHMVNQVVIESFIIDSETHKKSWGPDAMHLIGVVKYLCAKYDVPCCVQSRNKKAFATNQKLQVMGMWIPGGDGHCKDAARHVLAWMEDNGHLTREDKLRIIDGYSAD